MTVQVIEGKKAEIVAKIAKMSGEVTRKRSCGSRMQKRSLRPPGTLTSSCRTLAGILSQSVPSMILARRCTPAWGMNENPHA